ncbi:LIM-domain-containing protein [Lactarius vividus]|nr:LIM-domain-containing protein [Lactarius vividus]
MHPFGGTPTCPRCSKAVYAAEQVMGPGRKLYHKPCLTCTSCGVRLDSFRLLEHEEEPYCKNCHSKMFGTRDLRQANLPHRPVDPSVSPTLATETSPSPTQRPRASPPLSPLTPPPQTSTRKGTLFPMTIGRKDTSGDLASSPGPLLRPTRVLSPTRGNFVTANTDQMDTVDDTAEDEGDDLQFTPSHTGRSEGGLPRTVPLVSTPKRADSPTKRPAPATIGVSTLGRTLSVGGNGGPGTRRIGPLVANSTGTRYGAALTGELRSTATGGSTRQWGSGTPQCPRCNKSVYFAEQVKAIGKTWHKGCLRCSECSTSLDSSRLTEKDGDPLCHRCYNKLHGPAGSGYALLGKAGG